MVKDGPLNSLEVKTFPTWKSCLEGKITKRSSTTKGSSQRMFELVHTNLYGPISAQERGEYKYFITFTGDCLRHRYIYLI